MAKTYTDLKKFIGAGESYESDDLIQDCFNEASALVSKYVGEVEVPEVILDRALMVVGADLWNSRSAPNGLVSQQFATADGIGTTALRISRDPMAAAYKLLSQWVLPF